MNELNNIIVVVRIPQFYLTNESHVNK